MVGAPASGKSTWRLGFKGRVINPDTIRREVFNTQFDPAVEPQVWSLAMEELDKALAAGEEVCFDATNITRERRRPLIELAKKHGAVAKAVYFPVNIEILLRRNRCRPPGHRVPEGVVVSKAKRLEPPTPEEGFDYIETISYK
ncbi:MAG: AAA family ATPase [Clostridia bacterium]|nr:AAA family ATPase [Clostridia bacterium]